MRVVTMVARGFRLGVVLPVIMTLTLSAPPALADNVGAVFGSLLGTMIVLGAQEAAKNQQQTELQRQQAAKQQQILQQKKAVYKRAQTALQALGFYQKTIDGDWGSGSKSALAAYQSAFNLPQTELDDYTLSTLEQIASEGWRSADEFQQAQAGGFYNRDELVAAQLGNFQTRADWQAAAAAGFDNRAAYQDFARSGFSDSTSYIQAQAGGFTSPSDYAEASELGFDNAEEFYAFRSGSYASKAQFDDAKQGRAAAESARISCTNTSEYIDAIERDTACQLALTIYPNDPGVTSFAQAARDDLAAERHSLPLEIDKTQRKLTILLSNPDKLPKLDLDAKIAGLRSDLDELSLRRALILLQDDKVKCSSAMSLQDWSSARDACDAALARASETVGIDTNPGLVQDLQLMASKADDQARIVAEQAAKEKARLAIASANDKANTLIADVTSYSADGHEFGQGLQVARALVALNLALKTQAAEAIENAYGELNRLVTAETGFITYRDNKIAAAKQVETSTAVAARRDSENLNGFLKDYISHNLTAANIGELLDLQARLDATLQKGNAVEIASLLAAARQTVFKSGLGDQFDGYVRAVGAPIVTDDVLAQDQAEQMAQSMEIATAETMAAELVDEVGAYSQSGARFADPLAVGRALVSLREALATGDASAIVQRTEAMEAVLAGDAEFQASRQQRLVADAQSRQNARVLAGEAAQSYSAYLVDFITNNITSPDIATLIGLQDQVDAAIKLADWQQIMVANSAVENYLGSNALEADYAQFAAVQKAKQGGPQVAAADNGIALNAANSELLSGDDADILVLKNAGGSAPNMAVNLLGNLTFDNSTAKTCWLNAPPAISTATLLMQNSLRQLGAARLSGGTQCGADYMSAADLVLVERGAFLKRSATDARPAILDFEKGRLSTLVAITTQQVAEFEQTLANSSRQLSDQIVAEEKKGFGLIYLPDGEGDICFASDTDAYANANLVAGQRGVLQFYYGNGTPNLTPVMLDRSFVLAQRGACSGIYADATAIKQLLAALDREGVPHLLVPMWISNEDYRAELAQIDETNQQREARLEAQRQKAAAEAELQRQQNQTAEKLRLAAQDKIRDENRTKAVGAAKDLGTMAMAFVEGTPGTQFSKLFPETAQTRSQQSFDKWQVTSNSYTLKDYGAALWQNRRVPAVFVEMRYQSENAVLGLYREDCSVVGYLIDEEFSQIRDPVETVCVNTATTEDWKRGHTFESGWYAK